MTMSNENENGNENGKDGRRINGNRTSHENDDEEYDEDDGRDGFFFGGTGCVSKGTTTTTTTTATTTTTTRRFWDRFGFGGRFGGRFGVRFRSKKIIIPILVLCIVFRSLHTTRKLTTAVTRTPIRLRHLQNSSDDPNGFFIKEDLRIDEDDDDYDEDDDDDDEDHDSGMVVMGGRMWMNSSSSSDVGLPNHNHSDSKNNDTTTMTTKRKTKNQKTKKKKKKGEISKKIGVVVATCREDDHPIGILVPYLFPSDRYDVVHIVTSNGIARAGQPSPDILLCLGYFYPREYTSHRKAIGDRYGRLTPPRPPPPPPRPPSSTSSPHHAKKEQNGISSSSSSSTRPLLLQNRGYVDDDGIYWPLVTMTEGNISSSSSSSTPRNDGSDHVDDVRMAAEKNEYDEDDAVSASAEEGRRKVDAAEFGGADLVPHTNDRRRRRPFQLAFSYEAWDRGHCRYDVLIITTKTYRNHHGCPIIFWPFFASSFFTRRTTNPATTTTTTATTTMTTTRRIGSHDALLSRLLVVAPSSSSPTKTTTTTTTKKVAREDDDERYHGDDNDHHHHSRHPIDPLAEKTDVCAFVVTHCWANFYSNDAMIRVIFHDLLDEALKKEEEQQQQKQLQGMHHTNRKDFHDHTKHQQKQNHENQTWMEKGGGQKSHADGWMMPFFRIWGDVWTKPKGGIISGVSALGRCRRNSIMKRRHRDKIRLLERPKRKGDGNRGVDYLDTIVDVYRSFKFAIVFENTGLHDGYVTEKIVNALLADTIPIYWGASDIGEYFNLRRIVRCRFDGTERDRVALRTFRSLAKPRTVSEAENGIIRGAGVDLLRDAMRPCIEDVLKIHRNDTLHRFMLSQPSLPNNRIEGTHFDLNRIAHSIRSVLRHYHSHLIIPTNEKEK